MNLARAPGGALSDVARRKFSADFVRSILCWSSVGREGLHETFKSAHCCMLI